MATRKTRKTPAESTQPETSGLDSALDDLEKELSAEETKSATVAADAELDALEASEKEKTPEGLSSADAELAELEAEMEAMNDDEKTDPVGTFPVDEPETIEVPDKVELSPADKVTDDGKPATETLDGTKPKSKAKSKPAADTGFSRSRVGQYHHFDDAVKRLGSVDALTSNIVLSVDDVDRSEKELKDEFAAIMDALPKKVGEKAINIMAHIAGSARLSCYTEIALKLLLEKGEVTRKEIYDQMRKRPYSEGTSNSQTGQIMTLLPALKIAQREGNKLTLSDSSTLAAHFKEALAA